MRSNEFSIFAAPDFVELSESPSLTIDLRYATSNNFLGRNLYGEFNRAYLHKIAAGKLEKAIVALRQIKPAYKFIIFDVLRPRSVQYVLWDAVKNTEQQTYIADPAIGSIHNFGMAVDLSILDESGKELDMGTPFDDFTLLAQPKLEDKFLREGRLSEAQIGNRLLLRRVMEDAGFIQLPHEWWHFDALPHAEVRGKHLMIE